MSNETSKIAGEHCRSTRLASEEGGGRREEGEGKREEGREKGGGKRKEKELSIGTGRTSNFGGAQL